jgi:hypothetical protein
VHPWRENISPDIKKRYIENIKADGTAAAETVGKEAEQGCGCLSWQAEHGKTEIPKL